MLGWLFPRPPIDPVEKAWTETHMLWLAERLGLQRLLTADVISATRIVQDDYDGTPEMAESMLARMCEPLELEPKGIRLEIAGRQCGGEREEDRPENAIRIADELLPNPFSVAAVLARELAFLHLPLKQLTGPMSAQVGWLADLAAVYLGCGVVVAHTRVGQQVNKHSCGCGPSPTANLLPARMMGYALALFAYVRDDMRPPWSDSLRLDAQAVCNRSMKYLRRTDDTLFNLEHAGRAPGPRPTSELLHQLQTGSQSARVAALWELRDPSHGETASDAVAYCLQDRLPAIREEAAKTIGTYGALGQDAMPSLVDLLADSRHSIRGAAVQALGAVGTESEEVLGHLATMLRDPDRYVVYGAATSVEKYGEDGIEAVPFVLSALRGAVIRCDHELIDTLTNTLYALDPDPTERVMEHFDDDPELREQVAHVIVEALRDQPDKLA